MNRTRPEIDIEDKLCWWCGKEIGYGVDPNTAGDEEPLHYWCTDQALRRDRLDEIVRVIRAIPRDPAILLRIAHDWSWRLAKIVSSVRKSLLRKG